MCCVGAANAAAVASANDVVMMILVMLEMLEMYIKKLFLIRGTKGTWGSTQD